MGAALGSLDIELCKDFVVSGVNSDNVRNCRTSSKLELCSWAEVVGSLGISSRSS